MPDEIDAKKILNSFSVGKLEETTGMPLPSYYVD